MALDNDNLNRLTRSARSKLLTLHYSTNTGHVGSTMSCIDSLVLLYNAILTPDDHFILSKGHAAAALYVAMCCAGLIDENDLDTYATDSTSFPMHPHCCTHASIPFCTGSLGHGASLACGMALGLKIKKQPGRVYCLTSDGEWQEGSSWEAAIFANHNKLENLTILVDVNGLQGFGGTHEVASMGDLASRFKAFGLKVDEADGHDIKAMQKVLGDYNGSRSQVILLHTIKGKGVPCIAGTLASHYLPLTDEQYAQGIAELAKGTS